MVIKVTIEGFAMIKILVDQGSSVDLKELQISETEIQPYNDQIGHLLI